MGWPSDGPEVPPVVRTDDARFESLPGFDFAPRYVEVEAPEGSGFASRLRMHYVDEGPRDAPVVLMVHGEPTWSYLYRKLVPVFRDAGLRAVVPDHVGFGRSDKPTRAHAYTFEGHVDRLEAWLAALDLRDVTLVCQDWGGPIALAVLARQPERFSRIVVANTMLHTTGSELEGRLAWSNHSTGDADQTVASFLLDWMHHAHRSAVFRASDAVRGATRREMAPELLAAYDAPFPSEWHEAGMRQFPLLIPVTRGDPGAAINRATWEALSRFERPLLTLFGDTDPGTGGWDAVFRERVPGAAGQPHRTLEDTGHFWQEDCGEEVARIVRDWIAATPVAPRRG